MQKQSSGAAIRLCARAAGRVRLGLIVAAVVVLGGPILAAQQTPAATAQAVPMTAQSANPASRAVTAAGPIAIVPIDSKSADKGAVVTGALEVTEGRAIIAASGTVTSGKETTQVILPHRGVLRVCAATTVKLAADTSVPADEIPGLMMAMDHGAIEANFATGQNSDTIMTPDFRILIGGPGAADVKVRLGEHGDTCVDNAGVNAPYVLVSSVFDGGAYRVQAGQRVMFEHGSLSAVVDQEKEQCGCPPSAPKGNEFPEAQSEGLAPLAKPAPGVPEQSGKPVQAAAGLVYNSAEHQPQPAAAAPTAQTAANPAAPAAVEAPASAASTAPAKKQQKKKRGFFGSIGHFFRNLAGSE